MKNPGSEANSNIVQWHTKICWKHIGKKMWRLLTQILYESESAKAGAIATSATNI